MKKNLNSNPIGYIITYYSYKSGKIFKYSDIFHRITSSAVFGINLWYDESAEEFADNGYKVAEEFFYNTAIYEVFATTPNDVSDRVDSPYVNIKKWCNFASGKYDMVATVCDAY